MLCRTFGLVLWSVVLAAAAGAGPATVLARGDERTVRIAPGEAHAYEADLAAGEFFHLLFEQEEIDLVVAVIDPTGRRLEFDSPEALDVPESVALVSEAGGLHRLEVRPFRSAAEVGRYRLVVRAWRPATVADRLRADAEAATNDAHRRAASGTAGDLRAAAEGYGGARELWRRVGDRGEEARTVRRLGQLRQRLGDYDAALLSLGEALDLERGRGDLAGVAATLSQIGTVYRRLGRNDRALAVYGEALEIRKGLGDVPQVARVELDLGHTLQGMGEPRQALDHYERALVVFRSTGDRLREAATLGSMGPLKTQLGRTDQAAAGYERALTLFRDLGRRDLEADTLNNLGSTLILLGELHSALESFSAALEAYRALDNPRGQAAALNGLGHLLVGFGMSEEARPLLQEALGLLRENGDARLESRVLLQLGRAARELGELTAALAVLEQALDVERRCENRVDEAWALFSRAEVFGQAGRQYLARDDAQKALETFRQVGDRQGEVNALVRLGRSVAALGETEAARDAFREAAVRAEEIGDVTVEADSLRELARLERDQGEDRGAWKHLEEALLVLESLRVKISGERLRTSHFSTVRETYELAIDTLMQLHRVEPAAGFGRRGFALSERARARGLLDVLGRARVDEPDGDGELLAREKKIRREMNALANERLQSPSGALDERITALAAEYHLLQGRLAASDAGAGDSLPPPSVAEVAALLDRDTVLLEIALGEPRSYLWVLAGDRFESFDLPGRAAIEETAERLHLHLSRPGGDRAERDAALNELSRLLLAPAFEHLPRRRWVIVPDGALHYVPFATLPVPRQSGEEGMPDEVPLMVEHEVVHLPSAAVLARLRARPRRPAAGRLAIVADPVLEEDDPRRAGGPSSSATHGTDLVRLPWSGREAQAVATEAGGDGVLLALGFDASRDLVTSAELGHYRIVHFATHGVLDTRHPELSGLVLSRWDAEGREREPFLRLHDVYHLDWRAELVVLSGCETALGRRVRGEGLVGLARGFLYAGAGQVLASLWPVRDQATAELMRRFYGALFREGLPPSAALGAAQRSLWQERRFRDPHYWAPFVLLGDWRADAPAREPGPG